MRQISILAPAKLNLHLHIGDRRPDGCHDIQSLFLALAFGDVLHFETTEAPGLEIVMEGLAPPKNIIFRAVSLFRDQTGYDRGLKVTVEKKIPLGGGLGGGSSDAAAALIALNRLAAEDGGAGLDHASLLAMGASLGSDVPFFLYDASLAFVQGRGERVQPRVLPESLKNLTFVLVNPGIPSDTAAAYRIFDQHRDGNLEPPLLMDTILDSLTKEPRDWPFVNDFVPAFRAAAKDDPSIGKMWSSCELIFSRLREWGADFVGLSGSGSTCFGVFPDQKMGAKVKLSFESNFSFVIDVLPLAYHSIQCYDRN